MSKATECEKHMLVKRAILKCTMAIILHEKIGKLLAKRQLFFQFPHFKEEAAISHFF